MFSSCQRGARGRQEATRPRLWGFPDPRLPRQRQRYCVRGLWAARRAPPAPQARISSRDRQMAHERKLASCYKMVQNARGHANCARAQEGGGQAEPLVLLSVLSSRDTRVQTARYGSSRRRCSFLAAAAPSSAAEGRAKRRAKRRAKTGANTNENEGHAAQS